MPVRRLRSIVDLTDLVTRGDIIFLDIDETLVHPEFDASEPWAVALKDAFIEGGVDETVAWTVAVEMWQAMQSKCDVSAPEGEDTSKVLMNLKASGHVFVGLTARGPEMAIQTRDQLVRCGLGDIFQPVSLGELPTEARVGPEASRVSPLTHLDGIVYCSGSRKPAGLLAFEHAAAQTDGGAGVMSPQVRRQLGQHARVLLVDDRESHCVAVGRVIEQLGRPYLGLHYTRVCDSETAAQSLSRGWTVLAHALASGHEARDNYMRAIGLLGPEAAAGGSQKKINGGGQADQVGVHGRSMAWAVPAAAGAAVGACVALAVSGMRHR